MTIIESVFLLPALHIFQKFAGGRVEVVIFPLLIKGIGDFRRVGFRLGAGFVPLVHSQMVVGSYGSLLCSTLA